jgi:hypothetical protein
MPQGVERVAGGVINLFISVLQYIILTTTEHRRYISQCVHHFQRRNAPCLAHLMTIQKPQDLCSFPSFCSSVSKSVTSKFKMGYIVICSLDRSFRSVFLRLRGRLPVDLLRIQRMLRVISKRLDDTQPFRPALTEQYPLADGQKLRSLNETKSYRRPVSCSDV